MSADNVVDFFTYKAKYDNQRANCYTAVTVDLITLIKAEEVKDKII